MEPQSLTYIQLMLRQVPGRGLRQCLKLLHMEGFSICELAQVVMAVADGSYTEFHLVDGRKILAGHKLGDYEEFLSALGCFRISREAIVNLGHVWEWVKPQKKGRGGKVKLSTGEKLRLSRRRKKEFLELFEAGSADVDSNDDEE